jgi:hypothetical protein
MAMGRRIRIAPIITRSPDGTLLVRSLLRLSPVTGPEQGLMSGMM